MYKEHQEDSIQLTRGNTIVRLQLIRCNVRINDNFQREKAAPQTFVKKEEEEEAPNYPSTGAFPP